MGECDCAAVTAGERRGRRYVAKAKLRCRFVLQTALAAVLLATGSLLFATGVAEACPPQQLPQASEARALISSASSLATQDPLDPFYYTADRDPRPSATGSGIPHLPVYTGHISGNNTWRFLNVAEQVLTMVGEGKHGLWRVQENGTIREYLREGATGLPAGANPFDRANLAVLKRDYSHYLPEESYGGYKDPLTPVNGQGRLNFVDLPISHAKYDGKYEGHTPIDLPQFYCWMSADLYPEAAQIMRYAFAQKGANQIGPLGRRAGLDVEELYTNVLRLEPFPDARAWVNVGEKKNVHWKAVDVGKTNAEFYLYERPTFNVPSLVLTAVFDNKHNRDFSYVRPAGTYYDGLGRRDKHGLKTDMTFRPRFRLETGGQARVTGLNVVGVHYPGALGAPCPLKGGDIAGYPAPRAGAGWPTQHEEATPLCDGVLLDVKFFANLDGATWNDEGKYLANAGAGTREVTYQNSPGTYGTFTDPYLVRRGITNPDAQTLGSTEVLRYPSIREPVTYDPVP